MSKKDKWIQLTPSNKKSLNTKVKSTRSNLAAIVRDIRIAKGYSQEQLANIIGVDRKTINRIENEHFSPSLENLVKIFEVLEIKPHKVFVV